MDEKITIDDIAEALGVSKTTVSRAVSGKGRISEVTRARVLDYIKSTIITPTHLPGDLRRIRHTT
ncbi:LacI family DNA-binding transcriptional regulator [Eubacterium ruminantium]|uniref:LacI family DNA-binding transcriptional regulator n=1 Tax=Eubacterium ruminantium TaxID=42322 RepID=UPI000B0841A6|nr:LacI family DNA-binding transcriptional regulator [Eubacterium ruminantium]